MFDHMMIADAFYWMDTFVSPVLIKMFWAAVYWYTAILTLSAIVGVCMFLYLKWKGGRQKTTSVALVVANTPTPEPETQKKVTDKTIASEEDVKNLAKYNIFVWLGNTMMLIAGTMGLLTGAAAGQEISWETLSRFNLTTFGLTTTTIYILYTLLSIKSVGIDESAIQLFLGAYIKDVKPGWTYVPFWFCDLFIETKNIIERDLPGPPASIFYGDTSETNGVVPAGYIPALRIAFLGKSDSETDIIVTLKSRKTIAIQKGDPFLRRLIAEVQGSYGFKVVNLRKFYETIGTIDSATAGMDDNAIGGFKTKLPHYTVAEATVLLEELSAEVMEDLTKYSKDWGVEVVFTRITALNTPHKLNKAIASVPEAEQTKIATIKASEGDAQEIENIGLATANARADLLFATAEGEAARAEVASSPGGQFTMGVEAIRDGLVNGNTTNYVDPKNIFGMLDSVVNHQNNRPTTQMVTTPVTPATTNQPPVLKPAPRYGSGGNKKKGKGERK